MRLYEEYGICRYKKYKKKQKSKWNKWANSINGILSLFVINPLQEIAKEELQAFVLDPFVNNVAGISNEDFNFSGFSKDDNFDILRSNPEIMSLALRCDSRNLKYASKEYQNNPEIVMTAVT